MRDSHADASVDVTSPSVSENSELTTSPLTRTMSTTSLGTRPNTVGTRSSDEPSDSVMPTTTAQLAASGPAPAPSPVVSAATPPAPATPAPPATPADSVIRPHGAWNDGTFSGWGTSRHGDIEATVIIEKGRITAAAISRCLTRYSCSWIAHLQPQVVERQSPEVDNVSGATESANAFYYAVVEALKAAKP